MHPKNAIKSSITFTSNNNKAAARLTMIVSATITIYYYNCIKT